MPMLCRNWPKAQNLPSETPKELTTTLGHSHSARNVAHQSGTVSIYTINGDGTLTPAGQADSPTEAIAIAVAPVRQSQFDEEAKSKEDTRAGLGKRA